MRSTWRSRSAHVARSLVVCSLSAAPAFAQVAAPASPGPPAPSGVAPASSAAPGVATAGPQASAPEESHGTCVERVPAGKAPPKLEESFPARGTSGHVVTLSVSVNHLKGEEVLPGGFRIAEGDALRALERSQLWLPDPSGPAAPAITRDEAGTRTKVEISLVPLPSEPWRH